MDRLEFLIQTKMLKRRKSSREDPIIDWSKEKGILGFWSILRSLMQENLPKMKWIIKNLILECFWFTLGKIILGTKT